MSLSLLDSINSPSELKSLDKNKIPELIREIREFLIERVNISGGHLASNLGVVELTVALHRVFDSPEDRIIFDVGHQSYVHKLLTGRRDEFDTLRTPGGLSGFTSRRESPHDPFGAGHCSTSVSAALGFAEAELLRGGSRRAVAVLGDGAYTGGMVHEALNNVRAELPIIIVINENGMCISENKGAFASYLSRVRASDSYFLDLGFDYIGQIDGNDYEAVEAALADARSRDKAVVVHLTTVKGKGYQPSEASPTIYHNIQIGDNRAAMRSLLSDELIRLAEDDKNIVAVTAAMGVGTGLSDFAERFPDRYFDVGIAEAHALTFSAGLAAAGLSPFVAIYSTFLQRAYDSILHDVALQELPVRMLIDRAGLAVSDGATHHGIFDVAFLSTAPGMQIFAPVTPASIRRALAIAASASRPIAIRYSGILENTAFRPLSEDSPFISADFDPKSPPSHVFVTYGYIAERVIEAKELLAADGIDSGIILLEELCPYDAIAKVLMPLLSSAERILFVEEGVRAGGAAQNICDALMTLGFALTPSRVGIAAIDNSFASPENRCDLYDYVGLSAQKLKEKMLK